MARAADDIAALVLARARWSDAGVLAELTALEPLPEEEIFDAEDARSAAAWARAKLFVALGDVCATRKLRPAAKLLLGRASEGDPSEMMRGLRHVLEAIFNPAWDHLALVCVECMGSPHAGARMWAADELGRLEEPVGFPALLAALDDPRATVRSNVGTAIGRLCRAHPRLAAAAVTALRTRASRGDAGAFFEETARQIAEAHGVLS